MKRQIIFVLGMHRSGTSAVAGILNKLGVSLGSRLMEANEYNEKGYFENSYVVDINNEILETLDSSWDDLFWDEEDWWKRPQLSIHREKVIDIIEKEFGSTALFSIKDPRICLLLPFWTSIIQELNIEPVFIITVRHPMEVAESLRSRDGFSIQKGLLLWMNYMLDVEHSSRDFRRTFVSFDAFLTDPVEAINRISTSLNVNFPKAWSEIKNETEVFLDIDIKHHTIQDVKANKEVASLIWRYYQILLELTGQAKDNEGYSFEINKIKSAYKEIHRSFYNQDVKKVVSVQKTIVESRTTLAHSLTAELQRVNEARKETTVWTHSLAAELQRVSKAHEETTVWANSLTAELQRVSKAHEETTVWAHSLATELQRVSKAHEECAAWAYSLDVELKQVQGNYERLRQDSEEITKELIKVKAELNEAYRSISWRITFPLRLIYVTIASAPRMFFTIPLRWLENILSRKDE